MFKWFTCGATCVVFEVWKKPQKKDILLKNGKQKTRFEYSQPCNLKAQKEKKSPFAFGDLKKKKPKKEKAQKF